MDVVKLAQLTAQAQTIAEGIAVLKDKEREIKLTENQITHGNWKESFTRIPGIELCNQTLVSKEARALILERMQERLFEIAGEIKRAVSPTDMVVATGGIEHGNAWTDSVTTVNIDNVL